ncbi:hypothetical protein P4593_28435, partial [Priestia megaterium]
IYCLSIVTGNTECDRKTAGIEIIFVEMFLFENLFSIDSLRKLVRILQRFHCFQRVQSYLV